MSVAFPEPNLETLVRERIGSWRAGAAPDAAAFIDEHPELRAAKSLVLELILEEYCLRKSAGDEVTTGAFCDRFPSYRQSVFEMLEVQDFLDQRPQFAEMLEGTGWPRANSRFLGFDIVEPLGYGALARAYLAREPALGNRLVVIKVSRYGTSEAHTLGKLSHPNIVPIHSVHHDDASGWTAICMPLLGTATGVDLLDAVRAGQALPRSGAIVPRVAATAFPLRGVGPAAAPQAPSWNVPYPDAVARIGLEIAAGLQAAHVLDIWHGDIKPSNVLLAWSGQPMLLDFNLAQNKSLASERVGGTPAYMAPELLAALMQDRAQAARQYDARCDLYSLGVVLYELLTGQLPARPDNASTLPAEAYQAWLPCKQLAPPGVRTLAPEVSRELEEIVRKCLAPLPSQRYALASELSRDLARYLSPAKRVARLARRHRRSLVLGGLALAAAVTSGVVYEIMQPPLYDRLLQSGLSQYERGQYREAVESFTLCLVQREDQLAAHFGRGQSYRRLRQWDKARSDFLVLAKAGHPWGYAFAGECDMDLGDTAGARNDMVRAYEGGIRHIGFLLNYADVLNKQHRAAEAIEVLNEAVRTDATSSAALRFRARLHLTSAMDNQQELSPQAIDDTERHLALHPDSSEALFVGAIVRAYASIKNPQHQATGTRYLIAALERGLPRDLVEAARPTLKPIWNDAVERLVADAALAPKPAPFRWYWRQALPDVADWRRFDSRPTTVAAH